MNCPLKDKDYAQLIEYSSGTRAGEAIEGLAAHIAGCAECGRFVQEQRAVWDVLGAWDGPPVSADFDERLYQRIESSRSWWHALLRPLQAHRGLAAATAAACLLVTAAVIIERNPDPPARYTSGAAVVDVQPEQLEKALDTMDVLSEFSAKAPADGSPSRL
jgi:hypothetical protein